MVAEARTVREHGNEPMIVSSDRAKCHSLSDERPTFKQQVSFAFFVLVSVYNFQSLGTAPALLTLQLQFLNIT